MPIKLFSVQLDEHNKVILATNTKARAASVLQTTVYYINQYSLPIDLNSNIAKVAINNPNVIFKSNIHKDDWYKITP